MSTAGGPGFSRSRGFPKRMREALVVMPFEALNLLQSLNGDPDLPGAMFVRGQHAEQAQELAEEREAEARRARSVDEHEQLALANRAMGDPYGAIRRHQEQDRELADEEADLQARLEKVQARRESNRSAIAWWSDRLLVVGEQVQRSRTPDPLEAATMRAADALRQVREGRMTVEAARRNLRQRSGRAPRRSQEPASVLTSYSEPWQ